MVFYIFILSDIQQTPYIQFTSHGTHSHPPPPPNKPPTEIVQDILEVIHRMRDPDLTLGKLF